MQKLVFVNGIGNEINLTAGHYGITNWSGLSDTDLSIQTQQVPFQDGSVFLDALLNDRELSFTVAINDDNDLTLRYQLKRKLISMLNPKLNEGYLYYTNDYLSRRIKVEPKLPIFQNKNSNDSGTLKASVTFTACGVYWEDVEETVVAVNPFMNVINDGDVPVNMKMDIVTANVTNPTIFNATTSQKIEYKGALTENLNINTLSGEKFVSKETISLNGMTTGSNSSITFSPELGLYCLVNSYYLAVSDNVKDWEIVNTEASVFYKVKWIDEKSYFLAIGVNLVAISYDGYNWDIKNNANTFRDFDYSESLDTFIFTGYGLNVCFIYKSDDLENYTLVKTLNNSNIHHILAVDELSIVFAFGANGLILTSSDGETWGQQTSGVTVSLNDGIYNDLFNEILIIGNNGIIIASSDGVNWNVVATGVEYNLYGIAKTHNFNKKYNVCIVGAGGKIIVSKYGYANSWVEQDSGVAENLFDVIFNKQSNMFCAIGANGVVIESYLLQNWKKNVELVYENLNDILIHDKKFYVVGENGYLIKSNDFYSWEKIETNTSENLIRIKYFESKKKFCIIGANGLILTSSDGETWEQQTSGVTVSLNDVDYSPKFGKFCIVGDVETSTGKTAILISDDLTNWTINTQHSIAKDMKAIKWVDDLELFCAVGINLTIYSLDSEIWNRGQSFTNIGYYNLIWDNYHKILIAAGSNIIRSSDGVNWAYADAQHSAHDIAFSDTYFMYLFGYASSATYISDFINFNSVSSYGNWQLTRIIWSEEFKKFYLIGSNGALFYNVFNNTQNEIQNIGADSDMNMYLAKGNNKIRIAYSDGNATLVIRYRQKYVGV